jgi:hypothetical protein
MLVEHSCHRRHREVVIDESVADYASEVAPVEASRGKIADRAQRRSDRERRRRAPLPGVMSWRCPTSGMIDPDAGSLA